MEKFEAKMYLDSRGEESIFGPNEYTVYQNNDRYIVNNDTFKTATIYSESEYKEFRDDLNSRKKDRVHIKAYANHRSLGSHLETLGGEINGFVNNNPNSKLKLIFVHASSIPTPEDIGRSLDGVNSFHKYDFISKISDIQVEYPSYFSDIDHSEFECFIEDNYPEDKNIKLGLVIWNSKDLEISIRDITDICFKHRVNFLYIQHNSYTYNTIKERR